MLLKQVAANTQLVPRDSDKNMVDDVIGEAKTKAKEVINQQRRTIIHLLDKFEREVEEQLSMMERQLNFMSTNADQLSIQLLSVKSQAELQKLIDNIVDAGLNNEKSP